MTKTLAPRASRACVTAAGRNPHQPPAPVAASGMTRAVCGRLASRSWLRSTTALSTILQGGVALALVSALTPVPRAALANPEGGVVVEGGATIAQTAPGRLDVTQGTDKAIINWQRFDIGASEHTHFSQPSSSSITLNRVVTPDPSEILGRLSANGHVWLVNPSGIFFGPNARIDVAGLVATTHDIRNEDFMAGRYVFQSDQQPSGIIENQGRITAADAGLVALVAPGVVNHGVISARLGEVALASGNKFTVDFYGDQIINLALDRKTAGQVVGRDGQPVESLVANDGQVFADGGRVLMTATAARGVVDRVMNIGGVVQAHSVEQRNGEIILSGGDGGFTEVTGTLDASGKGTGQTGGTVQVLGDKVGVMTGATVDVSGRAGGGTALIGGDVKGGRATDAELAEWRVPVPRPKPLRANADFVTVEPGAEIHADALDRGDGGTVVVWADDTTQVSGTLTARGGMNGGDGGFVETSGRHSLQVGDAVVSTVAPNGSVGTWLLDPQDFVIGTGGDIASSTLMSNLAITNVTITSNDGSSAGHGDIFVNDDLNWGSGHSLSLSAYRNILVNGIITNAGSGALNLTPDNTSTGTGALLTGEKGLINIAGSGSLVISGHQYTLIDSASDLVNVNGSGYYALNHDLDLSNIEWNPIGYTAASHNANPTAFSGVFDGLGHTISHLSIHNFTDNFLGLFSIVGQSGIIENVKLNQSSLFVAACGTLDCSWSAPLAGFNHGTIRNVSAVGSSLNGARSLNGSDTGTGGGGLGGLVAVNDGSILSSYSTGSMALGAHFIWAGGIAAYNGGNGVISQSYSSMSITAAGGSGFAGKSGNRIGGLVGNNAALITDSFATGSVSGGPGSSKIGGLVGENAGDIVRSFATGAATGGSSVGGLVGLIGDDPRTGTVTNSYCNIDANPSGCRQGTGKTLAALQSQSTYSGWDFTDVWAISDGQGTPQLRAFTASAPANVSWKSLDADGLYKVVVASGEVDSSDSYRTDARWTAIGDTEYRSRADVMLQAYKTYSSLSGQALADRLYHDVLTGEKVYGVTIANNPSNAVWRGIYGPDLVARQEQKDANLMINSYQTYRTTGDLTKERLFADLVAGRVTIAGFTDQQVINNSPSNPVWRGIYGPDLQAELVQYQANIMKNSYDYHHLDSAYSLYAALRSGKSVNAVAIPGDPDSNKIRPDSTLVWQGISGPTGQETQAQIVTRGMSSSFDSYYGKAGALRIAIDEEGRLTADDADPLWVALFDGWEDYTGGSIGDLRRSSAQNIYLATKKAQEEVAREKRQARIQEIRNEIATDYQRRLQIEAAQAAEDAAEKAGTLRDQSTKPTIDVEVGTNAEQAAVAKSITDALSTLEDVEGDLGDIIGTAELLVKLRRIQIALRDSDALISGAFGDIKSIDELTGDSAVKDSLWKYIRERKSVVESLASKIGYLKDQLEALRPTAPSIAGTQLDLASLLEGPLEEARKSFELELDRLNDIQSSSNTSLKELGSLVKTSEALDKLGRLDFAMGAVDNAAKLLATGDAGYVQDIMTLYVAERVPLLGFYAAFSEINGIPETMNELWDGVKDTTGQIDAYFRNAAGIISKRAFDLGRTGKPLTDMSDLGVGFAKESNEIGLDVQSYHDRLRTANLFGTVNILLMGHEAQDKALDAQKVLSDTADYLRTQAIDFYTDIATNAWNAGKLSGYTGAGN